MDFALDDTIAAVASPRGGSVRGVIRLSGPGTAVVLERCFRIRSPASQSLGAVRMPTRVFGHLQLPRPVGPLACHLYWWPTCRSYTRQPSAELHTIGSPPLLDAALECLCRHGARLAQPGEFTLRAFLAGRLDLTQAEAVLGVIEAEDPRALQAALHQLAGGVSCPLRRLRDALLDLLADIEAGLDFVDEEITFITPERIVAELSAAQSQVQQLQAQLADRGQSGPDPHVVLSGYPNVGKSSLFNALLGRDAALVSSRAGTTRDYVSRPFHWHGVAGVLIDSAGIADSLSDDPLAHAAQQVAAEQAGRAQLTILCLDATRPLEEGERRILDAAPAAPRLVVWTKVDLADAGGRGIPDAIPTSSRAGHGLAELRAAVARQISQHPPTAARMVASTAVRCRHSLERAAAHLHAARQTAARRGGEELVALELRDALDQLGQLVGAVYTDDLLTRIFSRFCIGK